MRCATSLIRNLLFAVLLVPAPVGLWAQTAPDGVSLSLPQARALAAEALERGDPALAIRLARGLIKADRRDTGAWYIVAAAQMRAGNPRAARAAVTRAYRFAQTPGEKLQSAQLAARFAVAENRPTMAQVWLRRAAIHVADPEQEKRLAADYKTLRRINPWSFSLRTEVRPSDNVNNGSSAVLNTVDGVLVSIYPFTSQALSGTLATVDVSAGYRLQGDATSTTTLEGRLYVQRARLSDEARAQNPTARDADYNFTYARVALNHAFAVGTPEKRGSAGVDLAYSKVWYGQEFLYSALELRGERTWRLTGDSSLQVHGRIETRLKARRATEDATILGLGAMYGRRLANGDAVAVSLGLRDTRAASANGTSTAVSLRASYAPAQQIGPVQISTSLGLEYGEYPSFLLGNLTPARREDHSWYGEIALFFPEIDYAGFAPNLRLRHGQKSSNFSQFTSRETSVSIGIQSKF